MPPEHQDPAFLAQAAPVNGTFYVVLDTTQNCHVMDICFEVRDTGEDLECEIVIDGKTYIIALSAVANTPYTAYIVKPGPVTAAVEEYGGSNTDFQAYRGGYLIEGRSVRVRIRKVTAAGAGNINARVMYNTD